MESRHEELQKPHPRRYGLLLAGAAFGIAIGFAVTAAKRPSSQVPVAAGTPAVHAATSVAHPPVPTAAPPALEYPGAMGRYSDQPVDQPPTF